MAESVGRPPKYDPSFCDLVISYGKEGKSVAWMACELNVNKDSLYEWAKVYPEFSVAFTRARQESQRWWEDRGQVGMEAPGFNAQVWSRSMSARFPEDWREKKEIGGLGGGPIAIAAIDASKLSTETLNEIMAAKDAHAG